MVGADYGRGREAALAGKSIGECPYAPGDPAGLQWRQGWIAGESMNRHRAGTYGATEEEKRDAFAAVASDFRPDPCVEILGLDELDMWIPDYQVGPLGALPPLPPIPTLRAPRGPIRFIQPPPIHGRHATTVIQDDPVANIMQRTGLTKDQADELWESVAQLGRLAGAVIDAFVSAFATIADQMKPMLDAFGEAMGGPESERDHLGRRVKKPVCPVHGPIPGGLCRACARPRARNMP